MQWCGYCEENTEHEIVENTRQENCLLCGCCLKQSPLIKPPPSPYELAQQHPLWPAFKAWMVKWAEDHTSSYLKTPIKSGDLSGLFPKGRKQQREPRLWCLFRAAFDLGRDSMRIQVEEAITPDHTIT